MQDDAAKWIREALATTGKSQKGLASALGITQPQVSRLVNGKRQLRASEISVLESYFGLRYPQQGLRQTRYVVLSHPARLSTIPVRVVIAPGVWRERGDQILDQALIAASPDPRLGDLEQYSCRVEGVNAISPAGQYVVCVPYYSIRISPTDGDIVHVVRRRADLEEHTLRVVSVRSGKPYLVPYGTPNGMPVEAGTEAEIRGLVVAFTTPVKF
jgi:hypothetical protein